MGRSILSLVLFGGLMRAAAYSADTTPPASTIGFIFANGEFRADGYIIKTDVALFNGSTVDTLISPLHMSLAGGVRVDLAIDSRALVYERAIVLEKGAVQCRGNCSVVANGIDFTGTAKSTVCRIALSGDKRVIISVPSGEIVAKDPAGNRLADISAGRTFKFSGVPSGASRIRATELSGRQLAGAFHGGYREEIGMTKF